MKIFFNCLSVLEGGQIKRANYFISNSIWEEDKSNLVLLKQKEIKIENCKDNSFQHKIIEIQFLKTFLSKAILRIIWENIFINKFISKYKADIYLSFSNYLPLNTPNIPIILGVTNMAPFSKKLFLSSSLIGKIKLVFLRLMIINSCKKATKVIALSETCKNILKKESINSSKIIVIPNGVEKNSNINFKKPTEKKLITYISHFYNYKNHKVLLKAFSLLPDNLRKKYKLIFVGKYIDKKYVKKIMDFAKDINIFSECDFIPGLQYQDLKDVYQKTSLFIFPSLIENCPNTLLEAMSFGLPILCSNKMPMPEFGKDAVKYFDPYDYFQLSKKMNFLLMNKTELNKLSRKSKSTSEIFSWEKFSKNVLNLCKLIYKSKNHF